MKHFFILFLALICATSAVHAEVYSVNFASGATIVDEAGTPVIPEGKYERIYLLRNDDNNLIGYCAGVKINDTIMYSVLNSAGESKTAYKYSGIWEAGKGCIVLEGGLYRYLCKDKTFDGMAFGSMIYAEDGRLLAVRGNTYDDIADPVLLLNSDGTITETSINTLNGFSGFREGLMSIYDDATRSFGYIDTHGTWAIDPSFDYAGDFINGTAIVAQAGSYGVIDMSGEFLLPPTNTRLIRSESLFASLRGESLRVYNNNLELLLTIDIVGKQVDIINEYIILSSPESVTVISSDGNELFALDKDAHVYNAGIDRFIVREGRWGDACVTLRDATGGILCKPVHSLYVLDSSMLAYSEADPNGWITYGLMTTDGKAVTEAVYESLSCVTEGMYCADTRVGAVLLDTNGNILYVFNGADSVQ